MTLSAIVLAFTIVTIPITAVAGGTIASIDATGISLVGQGATQFRAQNETQANGFDAALRLAYDNRNHMGYPWVDFDSGTLVLRASDDAGLKAALAGQAGFPAAGWSVSVENGRTSIADLDVIADDATRLVAAGIPHAELIWMTEPDQMNDRVIITISESNAELMTALAARYGTSLIAVRIRAGGPATLSSCSGRDCDAPLFWGGAYWAGPNHACTTAFPWVVPGGTGMLTAAHCISTGGSVSYPSYPNVGSVQSASEENWNDTNGTQYYTGQSVSRGDVALIRYSSYGSAPYIYCGAAHSGTSCGVYGMASRWSQVGDAACVNGVKTGEWCGMVTQTGADILYVGGAWARHVNEADALGAGCPAGGDSGAPAYRKRSDGTVYAVGVLSGSAPIGVSCAVFFTDIWDAYYGLPGWLNHR